MNELAEHPVPALDELLEHLDGAPAVRRARFMDPDTDYLVATHGV